MVIVWLDSRAPDSSQGHAPVWALQDDGANGAKVLPIDDLEYFGQTDDIVHTHIQVTASSTCSTVVPCEAVYQVHLGCSAGHFGEWTRCSTLRTDT